MLDNKLQKSLQILILDLCTSLLTKLRKIQFSFLNELSVIFHVTFGIHTV